MFDDVASPAWASSFVCMCQSALVSMFVHVYTLALQKGHTYTLSGCVGNEIYLFDQTFSVALNILAMGRNFS